MTPNRLPAWLRPAPGSLVANALQRGKSPWADAVHLLWSAWVFITPMFAPSGYNARWVALTLLSYPLFLLLYAKTLLAPPRTAYRYALAHDRVVPGAAALVSVGHELLRVRLRDAASAAGALDPGSCWRSCSRSTWCSSAYALWIGYPWQAVVWMPVMTLIVGIIVHVERANQEKDAALRLSHDEVRRLAATAERERIGRDLHDLLGHTLSLVALKSDLAGRLVARDPDGAQREIDEVERVAREALSQVRTRGHRHPRRRHGRGTGLGEAAARIATASPSATSRRPQPRWRRIAAARGDRARA